MQIRRTAFSVIASFAGLQLGSPANADETQAAPRLVRAEALIAAPRSQVWEALTTRAGATTFFSDDARIELRFMGPYEIYFVADAPAGTRGGEGCRVLSYVPQEMISFTWNAPPTLSEVRAWKTFVVIQLSDESEGKTRVRLTHGGWRSGKQWDEAYTYFERAWPEVLANLTKRFETGPLWEAKPEQPAPQRKRYVYFIRPTDPALINNPNEQQTAILKGHVEHVRGLAGAGRLILAGPCIDPPQDPKTPAAVAFDFPTPGIVVFEAENDEQARLTMEADPAVKAGLFQARVLPLQMAFWRE